MKAVLHDWAKARPKGTVPRLDRSKFRNLRPPASTVSVHSSGVSGVTPWSSRAVALTILKVEPGGYAPPKARLNSPSGREAADRTSPSASTHTTAECAAAPATWLA